MDIVEEENKHKYMYHPTTIAVREKERKNVITCILVLLLQ